LCYNYFGSWVDLAERIRINESTIPDPDNAGGGNHYFLSGRKGFFIGREI